MTAKYDWQGNEWDYLTGLNPAKLSASNYGLVICLEIVARAERQVTLENRRRSVLLKHPQERVPSDRLIFQR